MKVLVIEDEIRLGDYLRRGLTAEGFAVEVARTGTDGLWAASEHPVDVIVCDIMLPGMNGYDVVRRLRGREIWTPVLMLTAKDGEYDEADALDVGADDYLRKPFSFVVLTARLRSLLRRGAPARPALLTCDDLRLDPAAKQVWRGDREIMLTPREFAVLEFLLRRRGDVVSKREILDAVWDPRYEGDPNVVEVYVGYLRKKIETPFGVHSITTVRGHGYRLDPGSSSLTAMG